ncbi:LamG-like jellyroll fold domain-containing protein [Marinilabilia rubra]|uniref:LamG-like jellyroll fold domain-containing protein n=1 Tax=Marinilabilia rubra TaxID=2162893 RepID=A0A2U2B652_9BACT|nr:LamG-like jellyroll fold domain-containing protein [Marinilabilia rubra]PWD98514.1 hypothetical protein DDZ16_14845 [Marinilabilia rubra]
MKNLLLLLFAFSLSLGVGFSQQIDPSLVISYLDFEGDLEDGSSTAVAYNQTQGDPMTFSTGQFGNAGVFSNMAVVSSGLGFNSFYSFSIAAWINHSELSSVLDRAQTWIHQKDVAGENPGRVHLEVLKVGDRIGTFTSGIRNDAEDAIVADTWYHVTSVFDANEGELYLYVDGVLVSTGSVPSPESNTGEIVVGAGKGEGGAYAMGMMDDFLITSEVLDAADIDFIMTNGVAAAMSSGTSVHNMAEAGKLDAWYHEGVLNLRTDDDFGNKAQLAVYSMSGQLVKKTDWVSLSDNRFNIDLKKGVYILKVSSETRINNVKFIVD